MAGPSTTQTQSNNSEDNIANQNQQPTENSADNVTEQVVADTQSSRPGAYRVGGGNNNDASANTNIAEQRRDGGSQLTDEQVGEVLGNLGITWCLVSCFFLLLIFVLFHYSCAAWFQTMS